MKTKFLLLSLMASMSMGFVLQAQNINNSNQGAVGDSTKDNQRISTSVTIREPKKIIVDNDGVKVEHFVIKKIGKDTMSVEHILDSIEDVYGNVKNLAIEYETVDSNGKVTTHVFKRQYQIPKKNKNKSEILLNNLEQLQDDLEDYNAVSQKTTYTVKPKPYLTAKLYFAYGYTGWSGDKFSFSLPGDDYNLSWGSSWDLGLNFYLGVLDYDKWSVIIGLWGESLVFNFDYGFSLGSFSELGGKPEASNKSQKLVARYVVVPLMLNYRFYKDFAVSAGIIGGVNFSNSHTGYKRSYNLDNLHIEESTGKHFKDFNSFKADVQAQISYKGFGFYYRQSLTQIFKNGTQKKLYPFAIGLMYGF